VQNILEILQTIGICVNALAVVAIAIMIFFIWSSFVPPPIDENDEDLFLAEEEEMEYPRKRKRGRRKR
jgi:hypothetical protein